MRDIFEHLDKDTDDYDPQKRAQIHSRRELPKRFYKQSDVEKKGDGFAVTLDGKTVKTPARNDLLLPSKALAQIVADEFNFQENYIDPAKMPITRLANTVIDSVIENAGAIRNDILNFVGNDMLFYRAATPRELVQRQNEQWNPVLDWVRDDFGVQFVLTEGVIHIDQPKESIAEISKCLDQILSPYLLAALHSMTTLCGSALLALAVFRGRISPEHAWQLAHLDEDWTIEHWGEDKEAAARRAYHKADFDAAIAVISAVNIEDVP